MPRRKKRLPEMPEDTTFHDARSMGKEYRSQELAAIGKKVQLPKERQPLVTTKERNS